jgi:pyridoxal phosphate enzyme (YggS family)
MINVIENCKNILNKIEIIRKNSLFKQEKINCVCISKKQSFSDVQTLVSANLFQKIMLGENYVQECQNKLVNLIGNFELHLTGPLQSNKIKKAVKLFDVIQTVDSVELANKINKTAKELNKIVKVFFQVNISDDDNKHGFKSNYLLNHWQELANFEQLEIVGLMTITRFYENPEEARPDFIKFRELRDLIVKTYNLKKLSLSMGMSQDYEIAIEEGADYVRIGTAIFGERLDTTN